MRIGVLGPAHADSFADNITCSLTGMGLDAVALGAVMPRLKRHRINQVASMALKSVLVERRVQARLAERALAQQVDLVLTVQGTLLPEVVASLRRNGVQVVLWYPDAVVNLGRQLMIIADYSAVFFKDPALVARSADLWGLHAHYLPEACNPRWHRPEGAGQTEPHVVVVGNCYGARIRLLERLIDEDVPFKIYGAPLPRWAQGRLAPFHTGEVIYRERKARVFRSAAAVLNNLHPGEGDGSNTRLFEATASGGVVLSEHRPAVKELYDDGSEILSFRSFDDLLQLVRRAVADPESGTAVADAAARRALAEHTYEHRLTRLLEVVA